MKRLDDGKVSLVEFLSSIKFAQNKTGNQQSESPAQFAHFHPRTRTGNALNSEDSHLIRSAN